MRMPLILVLSCVVLTGCAGAPTAPPRIERLPEGAAGPIAPARTAPLTLEDVVKMAQGGTPSNVIVQTLRDSRAAYRLSAAEGESLARRGVPDEVIEYLRTGRTYRPSRARPYAYGYPHYPHHPYGPGLFEPYGWSHPYAYPGAGFYFGLGRRW